MKKLLVLIFVGVFAAGIVVNAKGADVINKEVKKRFLAHSTQEVAEALKRGCDIVKYMKAKDIKAIVRCAETAGGALGLQEDVKVYAADAGANAQIGANVVHAGGNTGAGRKIAVLDTGYNYLHPELSSSYIAAGYDFVNNDSDPMDDNGHGSHVAGLITADGATTTARGVAPDAGIVPMKVLGADGSGFFSDVVEAIYLAVNGPDGVFGTGDEVGVDAISLSLGTGAPFVTKGYCDGWMPDMTEAVKYALSRNIITVVAAGNDASGVSMPGCISYSATVGAVDASDNIAFFSGRGNAVDIVAPGVSLFSSWLGSSYASASGTSMATPIISGTIALVKSAHPSYSAIQVQNAIAKTAKDLGKKGKDSIFGWGRVIADKAVLY